MPPGIGYPPDFLLRLLAGAKDLGRQGARGLAESGIATARGVDYLLPFIDASRALDTASENVREFYGEPEGVAGTVGGVGGRILGDLAQIAIPGTALARTAKGVTAGRAIAAGLPVDAVIEAGSEEGGTAGVLAQLAGATGHPVLEETLSRASENPVGRAGVGAGAAAVAGTLLSSLPDAAKFFRDTSGRAGVPAAARSESDVLEALAAVAKGPGKKPPKGTADHISLRELSGDADDFGDLVAAERPFREQFLRDMDAARFYDEIDDDWIPSDGLPSDVLMNRESLAGVPETIRPGLPPDEAQAVLDAREALVSSEPLSLERLGTRRTDPRPVNTVDELMQGRSDLPLDYDPYRAAEAAKAVMEGTGGRAQFPGPEIPVLSTRTGQPLTVFESPDGQKFSVLDRGNVNAVLRFYTDDLEPIADVIADAGFSMRGLPKFTPDDLEDLLQANRRMHRLRETEGIVGPRDSYSDLTESALAARGQAAAEPLTPRDASLLEARDLRYQLKDEIEDDLMLLGQHPQASPAVITDVFNPQSGSASDLANVGRAGQRVMARGAGETLRLMAKKAIDRGDPIPEFFVGQRITGANRGLEQTVPTAKFAERLIESLARGERPREFATVLRLLAALTPGSAALSAANQDPGG